MAKDINFTKALARLEEIASKLENQELDLEESVRLLAEGLALHKKCQEKLESAQSKIDKLLSIKGGDLK